MASLAGLMRPSLEPPPHEHSNDGSHPPARPRSRRRRVWLLLIAVISTVALVVAGIAGYALYLERVVENSLAHQSLLPPEPARAPGGPAPAAAPARQAAAGTALNVLIVGSDRLPGDTVGRSDVMVLAHVDRDRSAVTLVHLPRDMQVAIPGHGSDKINAAFALGGAPLLVSTVQDLLGVHIDHVAITGFEGFKAMTEALGGVDVEVEESSPGFARGKTHLSGERALLFVRERYHLSEGDISRGRREQAFLKALMLRAVAPQTIADPRKLAAFLEAGAKNTTVDQDLTVDRIRDLVLQMRALRPGDIRFITAPISGFATRPDGASINIVDTARMTQLGHALAVDDLASYPD